MNFRLFVRPLTITPCDNQLMIMDKTTNHHTNTQVTVIGGGQAGLGIAHHLKLAGISFVVLDANSRIGDPWRKRWDSLELFTPRPFASLPGLKVSKKYAYYPKKNEIADYFESYSNKFEFPIKMESVVTNISKKSNSYVIETNRKTYYSSDIVIATGPYTKAFIPDFANKLGKNVHQIHSSEYKNPDQVKGNTVVIVGGGNSATQLTEELYQAGKSVTLISSKMPWFLPKTILGVSSYWWFYLSGILTANANSSISRYVRKRGDGIIGRGAKKLIDSKLVSHELSRVVDATQDCLILENGKIIPVSVVIWATGFKPEYPWLNIAGVIGSNGEPIQHLGISPVAGVYWVGLPWQSRMNSGIINGIDHDARLVAEHIKLINTDRIDNEYGKD